MNIEIANRLVQLRKAHGLSQEELAARLGLSRQAVSKWERGAGCPDISMLPELGRTLGADVESLLAGRLDERERDGGNMKRIRFYTCPSCSNVLTATGEAEIACCGRRLEPMQATPCDEAHAIRVTPMDGEMHIAFDHGMSKAHHIRFVAAVGFDRVLLVRLYPEQGSELRMPYLPRATYYIGCSQDGLFTCHA